MGLINRISADGAVLEETVALVEDLAKQAPIPLRMGKAAFYSVSDATFDDAVRYLNTQLTLNLMTEDAMEGVAAFMQRRPPQWKGR